MGWQPSPPPRPGITPHRTVPVGESAAIYVHVLKGGPLRLQHLSRDPDDVPTFRSCPGRTPTLGRRPYSPICDALWADYGAASPSPDARFTLPPVKAIATTNLTALSGG